MLLLLVSIVSKNVQRQKGTQESLKAYMLLT
jgi:hypothetical protein